MIRIKDWWTTFENAGSRKLVSPSYFNSQSGNDSRGYRKLMRMGAEGVIAFGVFQALCQSMATLSQASRKSGEMRNSDGSELEFEDLCDLTRLPNDILCSAIDILEGVGWIDRLEPLKNQQSSNNPPPASHQSATHLPLISQGSPNGEERRGEEGRGEEGISCPAMPSASPPSAEVVEFLWPFFPKRSRERSSKKQLGDEWKRIKAKDRPELDTLKAALAAWVRTEKWKGGFAEGAHLWVKRRQWESIPDEEPDLVSSGEKLGTREVTFGGRTGKVLSLADIEKGIEK